MVILECRVKQQAQSLEYSLVTPRLCARPSRLITSSALWKNCFCLGLHDTVPPVEKHEYDEGCS